MSPQRPPTIDPPAARRWQNMPPVPSPWLHEEVARRMAQRLDWIKRQPSIWTHWAPVTGGLEGHGLLASRYPNALCHLTETTPQRADYAGRMLGKPWWRLSRWTTGATRTGPAPEASAEMLWANMTLHMAADPQGLIAQWHKALAVDGFLMFSCFGPDTLTALRALYLSLGWPQPAHEFTDMHDWGDMLVAAGFAEPVMDMERISLSFETPERMLQELRGLGRNLHPARFGGLRGRRWRDELHAALGAAPLQLDFEVIYGHAFKPRPKLAMRSETVLSLAQMREALSAAKTRPAGAGSTGLDASG
ncbi:MAG: biotin synthase [Betaproteobacteria bacterium]